MMDCSVAAPFFDGHDGLAQPRDQVLLAVIEPPASAIVKTNQVSFAPLGQRAPSPRQITRKCIPNALSHPRQPRIVVIEQCPAVSDKFPGNSSPHPYDASNDDALAARNEGVRDIGD